MILPSYFLLILKFPVYIIYIFSFIFHFYIIILVSLLCYYIKKPLFLLLDILDYQLRLLISDFID